MPLPFLICSQSDYLIQLVDINSHTSWQTVQFQISWILQKPTDLDLHCLQRQDISGFSRTRVNLLLTMTILCLPCGGSCREGTLCCHYYWMKQIRGAIIWHHPAATVTADQGQCHRRRHFVTFTLPHDKPNKHSCASSENSDQPRHPLIDHSLRCPHEEILGP